MKHTIENLWYGNIASSADCGINNPRIEKLIVLIERNKDKLNNELGKPQRETFEKYIDCSDEYINLITAEAFCDGFCLASKLLSEALSEQE